MSRREEELKKWYGTEEEDESGEQGLDQKNLGYNMGNNIFDLRIFLTIISHQ